MILFKSNRVTELLDDSSPFDALLAGQRRFRQFVKSQLLSFTLFEIRPLAASNAAHSHSP